MGQHLIGYPESVPSPHISIGIGLDHFGPYLVISFVIQVFILFSNMNMMNEEAEKKKEKKDILTHNKTLMGQ